MGQLLTPGCLQCLDEFRISLSYEGENCHRVEMDNGQGGLEGQELGILFHFTGKLIRPYPPPPPPSLPSADNLYGTGTYSLPTN